LSAIVLGIRAKEEGLRRQSVEKQELGARMGIAAKIVLESDGTLIRRVCSHRLEAGRFGLRPADLANFASTLIPRKRVKAGGSRERPNGVAAL
jgi:hypothetical protein